METPNIVVGCIVPVEKNDLVHRAEILSVRNAESGLTSADFYVHYVHFNKRLDEWVPFSRFRFSSLADIVFPKKKKAPDAATPPPEKKRKTNKGAISKSTSKLANTVSADSVGDATGDTTETAAGDAVADPPGWSKEKEIEKLRTSGSMTQAHSEIARVKNIDRIQMGKHEIETWYFAPYPEEFTKAPLVYICEFCLDPFGETRQFERHRLKYNVKNPPATEIYRNEGISFWELDGRKQKRYSRNLCLLSKLFLDHKTLYYDVDPFLFYIMTKNDDHGCHIIGYFSKEKESAENYNVACILTLPQHQRMGHGKVLIQFSYVLSTVEGKVGSPEKPLSDLGLLSYRSYWTDTIVEKLYKLRGETSIEELSQMTAITTEDILHTLQNLDLLKYYKGQHIICLKKENIEYHEKNLKKKRIRIDPTKLQWNPPQFSQVQLRWL